VFEKACDMLSLLLWCVWLMFYPSKDWFFGHDWQCDIWTRCGLLLLGPCFAAVLAIAKSDRPKAPRQAGEVAWSLGWNAQLFWRDKVQLIKVTTTSVFLWFCTCCKSGFILSLRAWTPLIWHCHRWQLRGCCHWRLPVAPVTPPSSLSSTIFQCPNRRRLSCFVLTVSTTSNWWSTFSGTIFANTSEYSWDQKITYICFTSILCRIYSNTSPHLNLAKKICFFFFIKDYHS